MEQTYFIIKSGKKGQPNWSGKEFSECPSKIYVSFLDVSQALQAYWFSKQAIEYNSADKRMISIVPITETQKFILIDTGKARL